MDLVWIELSRDALVHNLNVLRELGNGAVCSPCIKANAYGHGLEEVVGALKDFGCESVTVSTLEEARVVRKSGFEGRIILINYLFPQNIYEAVELGVEVMVYDRGVLQEYATVLDSCNQILKVHLAVESGMGRYGVDPHEVVELIEFFQESNRLELVGVMSHFSMADSAEDRYVEKQKEIFGRVEDKVIEMFPEVEFHIANSAGAIRSETKKLYRPGLALYGYSPSKVMSQVLAEKGLDLHPVMTLKSIATSVKSLPQGHCIGYDCTCRLERDSQVAVIPIGYADGYDRGLSNKGEVVIGGKLAPVIGRVCMNLTMIDVTEIPDVKIGDEVLIIGEGQSADDIAKKMGTISYEILSSLRESIRKIFVEIP